MAFTVTVERLGLGRCSWLVEKGLDADIQITIAHGLPAAPDAASIRIVPAGGTAIALPNSLTGWSLEDVDDVDITIGTSAAVGSATATARVILEPPAR